MRIFGFLIIAVSLLIVILSAFFGLALPTFATFTSPQIGDSTAGVEKAG